MSETLCVQCRTPHTATNGQLCHHHYRQLRQDLDDILTLWHLITDMIQPARTADHQNHRGKPIHSQAPANLDAICATDWRTRPDDGDQLVSVVGLITHWSARLTHEAHLITQPTTETRLQQMQTHLAWYTRHPALIAYQTDIHRAATMLRRIAGELIAPIGRHTAPHPDHPDRDCGGKLFPSRQTFGVWCIACGETYDGHTELARLGLIINQ